MSLPSAKQLLVYGGQHILVDAVAQRMNSSFYSDLWAFDCKRNEWKPAKCSGAAAPKVCCCTPLFCLSPSFPSLFDRNVFLVAQRCSHSAVVIDSKVRFLHRLLFPPSHFNNSFVFVCVM